MSFVQMLFCILWFLLLSVKQREKSPYYQSLSSDQIMSLVRFSCTAGMQCKLNILIFMWWPAHVQWGLELVPKNYGLCWFQFPKFYFFLLWSADLVILSSPELFEFKCARDLLDKERSLLGSSAFGIIIPRGPWSWVGSFSRPTLYWDALKLFFFPSLLPLSLFGGFLVSPVCVALSFGFNGHLSLFHVCWVVKFQCVVFPSLLVL